MINAIAFIFLCNFIKKITMRYFRTLFIAVAMLCFFNLQGFSWGQNGHRVVGEIASHHISKKTQKKIAELLGDETIAMASNFMDEIKSEHMYDSLKAWHYCTVPDGKTYSEVEAPEHGDVVEGIQYCIFQIKNEQNEKETRAFWLKCLIHLVGDVHQPLHVGNGQDKGANEVEVTYFWEPSNLHRVWDTGIIDQQHLSYTEYTAWIDHPSKEEVEKWQNDDVLVWVKESQDARAQIYDLPDNKKISYRYNYDNINLLNSRLLKAGVRLAAVLDEIFS